jgi:hypothetical protein
MAACILRQGRRPRTSGGFSAFVFASRHTTPTVHVHEIHFPIDHHNICALPPAAAAAAAAHE